MSKFKLPPVQLKQPSPAALEQDQDSKAAMSKRPPALQMRVDESKSEVKEEQQESNHDFYADSRVARDDTKAAHHSPFQLKAVTEKEPQSSNSSSPPLLQRLTEAFGGHDLSNVNIHKDSPKAPEVGAVAFAQGNDVHFAPGKFNPESSSGRQLIGHELAHVVQQREGRVQPTGSVNGLPLNDSKSLESEADDMGRKFAGG